MSAGVAAAEPAGSLPDYLTQLPRWVLWRREQRTNRKTGETTQTKVPISFRGGRKCDVTDPHSWADYTACSQAVTRTPGAYDGTGFVLGLIEQRDEYVIALDGDACLDEAGDPEPWVIPFLTAMPTYTEVSASGTGLHPIARIRAADMPAARRLLEIPENDKDQARTRTFGERANGTQHVPGVQLFLMKRYFAITGQHWPTSPQEVRLLTLSQIAELAAAFGPNEKRRATPTAPRTAADDDDIEPDEAALRDKLSAEFLRNPALRYRWEGGTDGLSDTSKSGRDMSVLAMLVTAGFGMGETRCALRLFQHGKMAGEDTRYFNRMWMRTQATSRPERDPNYIAALEQQAREERERGTPRTQQPDPNAPPTGSWRLAGDAEVFPPGCHFHLNVTTNQNWVFQPLGTEPPPDDQGPPDELPPVQPQSAEMDRPAAPETPSEPLPRDGTTPPQDWDKQHPPVDETPRRKAKRQSRATLNLLALVTHINTTSAWDGVLKFNLLTENYEICGPFPPKDGPKEAPRPLREPQDILLATMYFHANGFAKAGKNVVWDALAAVAHAHAYHPIRDYLNRLHWDATKRVGSLFQNYFKAEVPEKTDTDNAHDRHVAYLEHTSTSFMVGAVARVMQPGCKHDHVPVVVGHDQGTLKSTAIRALCHDPAWFTDNIPPDLTDRDTKESLVGKWIIELAEIPHVRRDAERLKAFLSSPVDRYRAAYGRTSQDHPRQSAFIGTSNDLEFVDTTGNRRFWPFISTGQIDTPAIINDRDQLWAEAVALYHQGVPWWLTPNIEKIAREKQEDFAETDVWDDLIADWIANRRSASSKPFTFVMKDLFTKDTGITPYRETAATPKADEMRAARCLARLHWHRSRCTLDGKRIYVWRPNA